MKESRSEKLSEYLSQTDDALLERAYEIDDAEKMKQYIRESLKKPLYKTVGFRTLSAAACFLLIVGFWISGPALFFHASSKAPPSATAGNTSASTDGDSSASTDGDSSASDSANQSSASTSAEARPPWNRVEETLVYTGGGYVFELYPSSEFVLHGEESCRTGTYLLSEEGVEFRFYAEEALAEKIFCPFVDEDGFVYNGTNCWRERDES